jgi:hypothetical protein
MRNLREILGNAREGLERFVGDTGISAKKQEDLGETQKIREDTWISRMRDTKRFIDDKDSWEIQKALREIDRSGGDEGDSGGRQRDPREILRYSWEIQEHPRRYKKIWEREMQKKG